MLEPMYFATMDANTYLREFIQQTNMDQLKEKH